MKQSTIRDIAKALNISPSTVSRALSEHPDIRTETKELVRKVANELNYSPNLIARSLKSKRSNTIGVIVPEIKHDFFAIAISGMEDIAYQRGYTLLLAQSNESMEREIVNTDMLVHQRVAGMIVSISQTTRSDEHFRAVLQKKIPLVFFDRVCEGVDASKVTIDDYRSAFDAVIYLLDKGYRRIAHFAGTDDLNICVQRRKGYEDALKSRGLDVPAGFIRSGGLHEQDGYASMDAMIAEGLVPEALFAVNDPVGFGAYQRIKEAKLRIPQDIAVVGFSNNKFTTLVDPQMTTVDQPAYEMGKRAADILIRTIEEQIAAPEVITVGTRLIVRDSA